MFAPGAPITPTPGLTAPDGGPRQWAYPVGYNIAQRPRATETTSFEQLRNLAALYDGIQICERVYFDLLGRLELRVLPRAELLAEGEDAAAPRWREPARRIEALARKRPTAPRTCARGSWPSCATCWRSTPSPSTRAAPAPATSTRSNSIAGESIKPLLDDGWPPAAAARARLSAVPLWHRPPAAIPSTSWTTCARPPAPRASMASRASSASSCASTRRCASRTSTSPASPTASTPLGFIEPPASLNWTPEQLETFERAFNGLLAGNDAWRVRAQSAAAGRELASRSPATIR